MFTDWSASLASIDITHAPERRVRAWLADAAQHQGALDAFVARCAARLGDTSVVRGATRCTQQEADQAVARGELLEALPEVNTALESGAIRGAHVDVLAKAAERTSVDAVADGTKGGYSKMLPTMDYSGSYSLDDVIVGSIYGGDLNTAFGMGVPLVAGDMDGNGYADLVFGDWEYENEDGDAAH